MLPEPESIQSQFFHSAIECVRLQVKFFHSGGRGYFSRSPTRTQRLEALFVNVYGLASFILSLALSDFYISSRFHMSQGYSLMEQEGREKKERDTRPAL